jgi:hypothetical protein
MNPFTAFNIYRKANTVVGLVKEAHMSKSLLTSKTFWINVLTASADLFQVLPLPPGWSVPTLAVINIVLRTITTQPVHIV